MYAPPAAIPYVPIDQVASDTGACSDQSTPFTADTGADRELWKYYHSRENINVNASLYDIREYFQGRDDMGKMNARSTDAHYTERIANLRQKLNALASKIAPKVYEHGFLKK